MYLYSVNDITKLQEVGAKFIVTSNTRNISVSSNTYIPALNPKYITSKESN